MTDRIAVDHELIVSHAARVEMVASDISVARDAGSSTNMSGGAFGLMCAFLAPPAQLAANMATQAIAAAEGMVRRSATEIRGVGDDLASYEDSVVQAVRTVEGAF
jgi:formylmethanofuran:tetrahydromethanopterin formyltransferase